MNSQDFYDSIHNSDLAINTDQIKFLLEITKECTHSRLNLLGVFATVFSESYEQGYDSGYSDGCAEGFKNGRD